MWSNRVQAVLAGRDPERIERIESPSLGLLAFMVIDSTALGPAAGGVRTHAYAEEDDALVDAARLARAMTYKCALAGLDAGGGKIVVVDRPGLAREAAFEELGRHVDAVRGDFRTAGDLGTTGEDLAAMARMTRYVHTDTTRLAGGVARGVVRCAEACADAKGRPGISGLRAAVQGCGDIGSAVARALREAGAEVRVADLDAARAAALAEELGATVTSPSAVLFEDVDLLAPCAVGDVITADNVSQLRAWAVCGGANHICVDRRAHEELHRRGVLFVPDAISSAGAVIEGIGRTVMGLDDPTSLIDALRDTAHAVLTDAIRDGRPPLDHALRRAELRLARAR
ncbi:MAG: Glu/Leu/Phe/Val dehydrogenase dimerization domain-containing protein [Sandaracinaceae bacterium]